MFQGCSSFLKATLGLNHTCRFIPTCSQYCLGSIKKHGFLKGGVHTCQRILKCHPWGKSGWDPVK